MTEKIDFGIKRRVISSMTSEGWESPHSSYIYEGDITELLEEKKRLEEVSFNTILLMIIVEGIKAAPKMNSEIHYSKFLSYGKVEVKREIHINMPVLTEEGEMISIKLSDFHKKTLKEMQEHIDKINLKIKDVNVDNYLLRTSLLDTMSELKKGKVIKVIGRLLGCLKSRQRLSNKKCEDEFLMGCFNKGTITVSNIGGLIKGTSGRLALLQLIPPQVCAIGINPIYDKLVIKDGQVKNRKMISFTIAFDHRAVDFGDIAPFIKRVDEIFNCPDIIRKW